MTLDGALALARGARDARRRRRSCSSPTSIRSSSTAPSALRPRRSAAGALGAIVPDVPLEETATLRAGLPRAKGWRFRCWSRRRRRPSARRGIAAASDGFVYIVSRLGRHRRAAASPMWRGFAAPSSACARRRSVPLAVGFGISTAGPRRRDRRDRRRRDHRQRVHRCGRRTARRRRRGRGAARTLSRFALRWEGFCRSPSGFERIILFAFSEGTRMSVSSRRCVSSRSFR